MHRISCSYYCNQLITFCFRAIFIKFIHVGLNIECTKWEKETLKFEIGYFNLRLWKNYGGVRWLYGVALILRRYFEIEHQNEFFYTIHMKTYGILRKQSLKLHRFCMLTYN